MLRKFKIPQLKNQSPQIEIVSHELQPRPQFLILPSDESLQNTTELTTRAPEKDIIGSISPESETLLATNILTALTEEPIPPTPTTPGIRDEYEDIGTRARKPQEHHPDNQDLHGC